MQKLLQIRKYIIGFIVAIISIFAINNDVLADELPVYNLNYDLITQRLEADSTFASDYEALLEYVSTIKDDYKVLLYLGITYTDFTYYYSFFLYIFNESNDIPFNIVLDTLQSNRIFFNIDDGNKYNGIFKYYQVGSKTVDSFISDCNNAISNNSFSSLYINNQLILDFNTKNNNIMIRNNLLVPIYSNLDITYNVDTFNINIDGTLVTNGDKFITYVKDEPIEEELDFLTILKMFVDFNIENIENTLNTITSRELLLIPFGVLLLISVIKIFKVVF